jgi:hypothetical protein
MLIKSNVFLLLILFLALFCLPAAADEIITGDLSIDQECYVPRTMTYQGVLKGTDGDPVPNSFFDVVFRIYDAETDGNMEWTESSMSVSTDGQGLFTVEFAMVDLAFDEDYWMELEIDTEILSPRRKLNIVPYAGGSAVSDYAWDSDMLDGNSSEYYATMAQCGSVFIGWGNDTAPEGSELIYNGYAYGSHIEWDGNVAPFVLITGDSGDPETYNAYIRPLSTYGRFPAGSNIQPGSFIKAAVCYSNARTTIIWGTHSAPAGWIVLYTGYALGARHTSHGQGGCPICVEEQNSQNEIFGDASYGLIVTIQVSPDDPQSPSGGHATGTFIRCAVIKKQ